MKRIVIALAALLLLRADMYQDASNAKLPEAQVNLGIGARDLVKNWGADNTGATDATAVLAAALSAGGTLYIPDGDYLIGYAGSDAGGAVAYLTRSLHVQCGPNARIFAGASGLDNGMVTIGLPVAVPPAPVGGMEIEVVWKGCTFDQQKQHVSNVVPFATEYPPPTGQDGNTNQADALLISGGVTVAGQDYVGMRRIEISGVSCYAGAHWQVAGGDSCIVVQGAREISVHGTTCTGSRDLCIYSTGGTAGNATPGGRIHLYNNHTRHSHQGFAVKRSVQGFTVRDNSCFNVPGCIWVGKLIGDGPRAGSIVNNHYEQTKRTIVLDFCKFCTVANNHGRNYGSYMADGITPTPFYGARDIAVSASEHSLIEGNTYDGVTPAYVALAPRMLELASSADGLNISKLNRVAYNYSNGFYAIGGESTAGEADQNFFDSNYNFNGTLEDIVAFGPLSGSKRYDWTKGKEVNPGGVLFFDGSATVPMLTGTTTNRGGVYFGINTLGIKGALIATPPTACTGLPAGSIWNNAGVAAFCP